MQTIALVSGANRGIGFEVCRQLGNLGFAILLTARDEKKAEAASKKLIDEGIDVTPMQLDVDADDSVERALQQVKAGFGRLDVLINNAGIDYDQDQRALTADLRRVQSTFNTNTIGAWRTTLAFVELLRASPAGRIVNVSSGAGEWKRMTGVTPGYSMSKIALNALTRMLANELESSGVLVNAVCPGWVATDMGGTGGRPVADGAAGIVWAATLPNDGPTGGFFRDGNAIEW